MSARTTAVDTSSGGGESPQLPEINALMAFDQASALVLNYLTEHIPMGYWSVSRVENGTQTHIRFNDDVYDLQKNHGLTWEDTFCVHMVEGRAPRMTPDTSRVPDFVKAQRGIDIDIRSYAGVPIVEPDGELFGVLCGHDPETKDESFTDHQPLLELVSTLLNMVLAADRARDVAARAATAALLASESDELTGLHNRRAWNRLMAEEQKRHEKYADPTVIVVIDVDGLKLINDAGGHAAGDRHLKTVAAQLRAAVRAGDAVARFGGDEFVALLCGCTIENAPQRIDQIKAAFADAGVAASVGWASVRPGDGFDSAFQDADLAMYKAKGRESRDPRPTSPQSES